MRRTYFWEGSWEKYLNASSYEIGLSPSRKSDRSISKVGARLLNSDPNDTWDNQGNNRKGQIKEACLHNHSKKKKKKIELPQIFLVVMSYDPKYMEY